MRHAVAAAEDSEGYVKLIKPVHHRTGLRLGIAHIGDWPQRGERSLEYSVVLGSFMGDWYTAAELYRSWSLGQPWARTPLTERRDVPDWLLDSPPHIIVRLQGELDLGPAAVPLTVVSLISRFRSTGPPHRR